METLAILSREGDNILKDCICYISNGTQMWQIVQTEEFYVLSASSAADQKKIVESFF